MKTRLIALLLLTVFVARPTMGAPLAVTREDQRDVAVTIYNGNLGLVRDVREGPVSGDLCRSTEPEEFPGTDEVGPRPARVIRQPETVRGDNYVVGDDHEVIVPAKGAPLHR